jgi:hypothetical protein
MSSTREVAQEIVKNYACYADPLQAIESLIEQREQEVREEERERAAKIVGERRWMFDYELAEVIRSQP